MNTSRRLAGQSLSASALGLCALGITPFVHAQATIKVGVLHSL